MGYRNPPPDVCDTADEQNGFYDDLDAFDGDDYDPSDGV